MLIQLPQLISYCKYIIPNLITCITLKLICAETSNMEFELNCVFGFLHFSTQNRCWLFVEYKFYVNDFREEMCFCCCCCSFRLHSIFAHPFCLADVILSVICVQHESFAHKKSYQLISRAEFAAQIRCVVTEFNTTCALKRFILTAKYIDWFKKISYPEFIRSNTWNLFTCKWFAIFIIVPLHFKYLLYCHWELEC